jgi:hypothetical protein
MIPEKMKARQRISKSPLQKGNIYAVTLRVGDSDVNHYVGMIFTGALKTSPVAPIATNPRNFRT